MLIDEVHPQPRVDEHMFIVGDASDWAAPLRQLEFDDPICFSRDGAVALYSAATSFYADLTIQVYDESPPEPTTSVDDERTLVLQFATPEVTVRDLNGEDYETLPLPSEGSWNVRIRVRGRTEAARRAQDEYFFRGEEIWLLQMWPASAHG